LDSFTQRCKGSFFLLQWQSRKVTRLVGHDTAPGVLKLATESSHCNAFFKHADVHFQSTRLPHRVAPGANPAEAAADPEPAERNEGTAAARRRNRRDCGCGWL